MEIIFKLSNGLRIIARNNKIINIYQNYKLPAVGLPSSPLLFSNMGFATVHRITLCFVLKGPACRIYMYKYTRDAILQHPIIPKIYQWLSYITGSNIHTLFFPNYSIYTDIVLEYNAVKYLCNNKRFGVDIRESKFQN